MNLLRASTMALWRSKASCGDWFPVPGAFFRLYDSHVATLNYTERRKLEEFLGMASGYVLDFSNRTFREFVHDSTGMDIDDANIGGNGSKAWLLRHFWDQQPDYIVGKLLKDMIDSVTVEDEESESFGTIRYGVRRTSTQKTECMKIADRLLQSAPVNHTTVIAVLSKRKSSTV
jgi:hypothetical protein